MDYGSDGEILRGRVFDIQRWSLHDGPGIRTSVFLKGCPLRCLWCSNPESQVPHPELAYFVDKCIGCGRCVDACPYGAISVDDGVMKTDRAICDAHCYHPNSDVPFPCLARCYSGGRKEIGTEMSVDDVMKQALKDRLIYEQSGGGITFTGGEPMSQPRFLGALLAAAKSAWVHTAIETCGFARWSEYETILPLLDFVFLDIKLIDEAKHEQFTGQSNALILANAPRIAEFMRAKGGTVVVRTPVIPSVTDVETVSAIADFIRREMPGVSTYELMPYHRLGRGKYTDIGRVYEMQDEQPVKAADLEPFNQCVLSHGLSLKYQ